MIFSYGDGEYVEGGKRFKGQIILGEHKLYLKTNDGDLPQTYVPLDKIEKIKKTFSGLEVHARISILERYVAIFKGERKYLAELVKDLVKWRGLKKKPFVNEWIDDSA